MNNAFLLFALMCCFLAVYGQKCNNTAKATYISNCGWNDDHRKTILDTHNACRNKIASGGEDRFSKAQNMRKLEYDNDLEAGAKAHVQQCLNQHFHPTAGAYKTNYGQNIQRSMNPKQDVKLNASAPVYSWYSEINDYTKSNMDNFESDSDTGHFTQVCWAETVKVGCYCALYKSSDSKYKSYPYITQVTCNYAPGGNMLGGTIYEEGEPCGKCTCDQDPYSSLCVTAPTS